MKKKFLGRRKGSRSEKRPDLELAERVKRLRNQLSLKRKGLTQETFAKLLGVKQSAVSAWEQGTPPPKEGNYVRLGNAALSYEDILWFWQRGGVDVKVFERAADKALKTRSLPVESLPVTSLLHVKSLLEVGGEEDLPFPASLIPNPLSTRFVRVPEPFASNEFPPNFKQGDILLIDTSETDLRKIGGGALVAMDFQQGKKPLDADESRYALSVGLLEKQDATIGEVSTQHFMLRRPVGVAFIGSSVDSRPVEPIREHLVLGRVIAWIANPDARVREKKT